MKIALTDATIRGIEPPETGRLEIADQRCSGLTLRVTPAGVRSWSFRFRDPESNRVTRATIGVYPDVGLAAARQQADELRRGVRRDKINPVQAKKQAKKDAETKTFAALADLYLEKHARPKKRTADADERNLRLHVLPVWGKRRFDRLSRSDVVELLDGMASAGKPIQANRVAALISKVFNFALNRDLVAVNPAARIDRPGVERAKRRVLSDAELALFWKRIIHKPVSRPVGLALRLCLLTATRAGEVAGLARSELQGLDTDEPLWLLPPERAKNNREFAIPLSPLAVETIREALALVEDDEQFVFPSPSVKHSPITGHSLAVAMARFARELPEGDPLADGWRAEAPTPHDLRRTAATRMSSAAISSDDVSACLNHVRRDVTGRHYDLYDRLPQKRAAFAELAAIVEKVINAPSNVVAMPGRKRAARS